MGYDTGTSLCLVEPLPILNEGLELVGTQRRLLFMPKLNARPLCRSFDCGGHRLSPQRMKVTPANTQYVSA